MKSSRLAWLILALLVVLAVLGFSRLFDLRLSRGDIYPPYSSLRADPLGTMAFYESLRRLPSLDVRRNLRPWRWLDPQNNATWFFIGVSREAFSYDEDGFRQTIDSLLQTSNRVVIAFHPEMTPPSFPFSPVITTNPTTGPPTIKVVQPFPERWGFQWAGHVLPANDDQFFGVPAFRRAGPTNWPAQITWHSALGFTPTSPQWRILYTCGTNAVLMERPLGKGSLVLASDSFLFSNEALRFHRASPILAWTVGQSDMVIFDEVFRGVREEPGVASLLRQYRLHGLVMVGLLLGLLYLWSNALPLLPLPADSGRPTHVTGRDATLGFINLLRRALPPRLLPRLCFEQWKESHPRRPPPDRLAAMEAALAEYEQMPPKRQNPLLLYQRLVQIAQEKSRLNTALSAASLRKSSAPAQSHER